MLMDAAFVIFLVWLFIHTAFVLIVLFAAMTSAGTGKGDGQRLVPPAPANVGGKTSRKTLPQKKKTEERLVPLPMLAGIGERARVKNRPIKKSEKVFAGICSVLGIVGTVACFFVSASSFFQANTALRYIHMQLERNNSVKTVMTYMAISGIGMAVSAAATAILLFRFPQTFLLRDNYGGGVLFLALTYPCPIWAAFFVSSQPIGCIVCEIFAVVFTVVYVFAQFFVSERRRRNLSARRRAGKKEISYR